MAIYIGDQKITGTGIQIDNELSDSSVKPVQNKAITQALLSIGYSDWEKPSDWIDIRSGALPNSIYLLVGHSVDYQTYPQFSVQASISNTGTYDVYVDGIKQATTASGTATTLDWATLALTSGKDVTNPTHLRTHIVRVTPSTSTNTITYFSLAANSSENQGLLWAHDTTNNDVVYNNAFGKELAPIYKCPVLQAVTAIRGYITCRYAAFNGCNSLVEVPEIKIAVTSQIMFKNCTALKKVIFADATVRGDSDYGLFQGCTSLREINVRSGALAAYSGPFYECNSLKSLPPCIFASSNYASNLNMLKGCTSLEDTVLDWSQATAWKRLVIGGTSTARIDGLKGLTVSNQAPFDHATSPQIDVSYTGLDRAALINLFNSMPTVTASQVCNITATTGAADLTAADLAIATSKGWTITR